MIQAEHTPVIHLVDDDDNFRISIHKLLAACGYTVRSYCSAEEYLSTAAPGSGCLLLDVNMPGLSGLELQSRLLEQRSTRPIVFLSGHGDIPMTVQALRGGAIDFLTKPITRVALLHAIELALQRDGSEQAVATEERDLQARFDRLTPREHDVFEKMMAGLLNKQIAFDLQTSERTIKGDRSQIMHKLGTRSLPDLTRMYDRYRELQSRG